ncbi:MAG: signal peptidase I [Pseudomonadota bacterium]
MGWTPNKWLGMALSLVAPGLGLLYAGAPVLALACFAAVLGSFILAKFTSMAMIFGSIAFLLVLGTVLLSYFLAKRALPVARRPWYARWDGVLGMFGSYVLLCLVLRAFFFEPYTAPSSSMAPSVPSGSAVVVQKWGYGHYATYGITLARRGISAPLERGDVIVFDYPKDPSQTWIKRLVGLPGDKVSYRDKRLVVNGVPASQRALEDLLDEEELRYDKHFEETLGAARYRILHRERALPLEADSPGKQACVFDGPWLECTVPAGHYFVLGDNRDNSLDSRMFGFVPASHIVGKVVLISAPVL